MNDDGLLLLQKLGFTAYEARAWLALAQAQTATLSGYEVAKYSDVPRANIYPVLKRLVDCGAVRSVPLTSGTRYAATPASELLKQIQREQEALITAAQRTLPNHPQSSQERPVYALQSAVQVHQTARRLIAGARESLFIALQPQEAGVLAADLQAADTRGVKITTLCMEACETDCGGCRGSIHRGAINRGKTCRWLLVVADAEEVATAEFDDHDQVRAIETRQPLVVQLAIAYVKQSAALAVLGGALGDRFEGLISQQTRQVLDGLQLGRDLLGDATTSTGPASTFPPETGIKQEMTR